MGVIASGSIQFVPRYLSRHRMLLLVLSAVFGPVCGGACSAPALAPELAAAEAAERAGNRQAALNAYERAQQQCRAIPSPRQRAQTCADAYLGRAELLARMGQTAASAAAYEQAHPHLYDIPWAAAAALYRSGRLYRDLGDDERGYALLWRTVTEYPDEAFAGDALKELVGDGRSRDADALAQILVELLDRLSASTVADNLLYFLADVAENELADADSALIFYDKLTIDYPLSGFRDDAFWHGARLARASGDASGAAERLRALLATREVTIGIGSYNSVWYDNAEMELGRILRDDLDQPRAALAAFARLPRHYPASILRDDALWERAVTWDQLDDGNRVCQTLARLSQRFPESRYQIRQAPALAEKHDCHQ